MVFVSFFKKTAHAIPTVLLLIAGASLPQSVTAQTDSGLIIIDEDGAAFLDQNGYDIFTGPFENNSDIPLPDGPVINPQEGEAQSVFEDRLAPNALNLEIDTENIQQQFQEMIEERSIRNDFEIQEDSLQFRSRFEVERQVGDHDYGEGIEVNVYGPDGTLRRSERAFVRGDAVTQFNGEDLPESDTIEVTYGPQERVELRFLNLRPGENGEVMEFESGVYPTARRELAVEDQENGGDRDFNDGDYFQISGGIGSTEIFSERTRVVQGPVETVEVIETPFVDVRVVNSVERNRVMSTERLVEVDEVREYGEVENPRTNANLLPHAIGLTTEEGEQLIYEQYSDTGQVRLGTEGATVTGQTAPLAEDPAAAPTLLAATATLDPFANENEAGLGVNVGITQYLNSTHEQATDMLGNPIENPNADGPRLLQPTGLFDNTRVVGYVEETPEEVIPGEQLSSVAGVYDLPTDRAIAIAPPNPELVGRGDSAYTRNVGGLIIEQSDGTSIFVPQWNQNGYVTNPLRLEAGEAEQVIYALVPQQPGQSLNLGQSYELTPDNLFTVEGGFEVISATQQPENFVREMQEVYAVEDTLPGQNATTEEFNGIRGLYEEPSGEVDYTVDVSIPATADARVGNRLLTEDVVIPGEPGQMGYRETTLAGGLYARGALSLGLGNQEDEVITTTSTFEADVATITRQNITETFQTPGTQIETITTTRTTQTLQEVQQAGTANFELGPRGLITELNTNVGEEEVTNQQTQVIEETVERDTEVVFGEEFLADREVDTDVVDTNVMNTQLVDRQIERDTDTYPNVSPLVGELAVGGILNFGNTPWTPAANTVRGEVFARGTVLGESDEGGDVGLRAEVVFHPFGEEQRPAYGYNNEGAVVPIFATEPLLDDNGERQFQTLENVDGDIVDVALNEFVYDENGDRIQETTGTGDPIGPGVFVRVEEVLDDDDGPTVAGGIQFTF